jgi:hypothetical protein
MGYLSTRSGATAPEDIVFKSSADSAISSFQKAARFLVEAFSREVGFDLGRLGFDDDAATLLVVKRNPDGEDPVRTRLKLIFGRDRKFLFDPQYLLRSMPVEKPLHIGRKFAEKIPDHIRAQSAAKTIHRVPERPVMSRVVTVL